MPRRSVLLTRAALAEAGLTHEEIDGFADLRADAGTPIDHEDDEPAPARRAAQPAPAPARAQPTADDVRAVAAMLASVETAVSTYGGDKVALRRELLTAHLRASDDGAEPDGLGIPPGGWTISELIEMAEKADTAEGSRR